MKKIPTAFERVFENHRIIDILPEYTSDEAEHAIKYGLATIKYDGSCCAVIDGVPYKRYDAKKGKKPPADAIPCQDAPDSITGHWPHWVKIDESNPADRWFIEAFKRASFYGKYIVPDGTYEAVGKHFNGNPYDIESDKLVRHGDFCVYVERTFEGIKAYLRDSDIEGLVFWYDGKPVCKIKRSDFGFVWPVK